jgi:hypothetical protein
MLRTLHSRLSSASVRATASERWLSSIARIGVVVLSLALLAGEVGIADGKKPKKKASLTVTATPQQVITGTSYTIELKGYSGKFTKLAFSAHGTPCAATLKEENKTHTIYPKVVPSKKNYDFVYKFIAGKPGLRHVCAYLYDPNKPGDTHQLHKSATYTSTAQ